MVHMVPAAITTILPHRVTRRDATHRLPGGPVKGGFGTVTPVKSVWRVDETGMLMQDGHRTLFNGPRRLCFETRISPHQLRIKRRRRLATLLHRHTEDGADRAAEFPAHDRQQGRGL